MKYTRNDFLRAPGHAIPVDEWISVEESDLLHHTQVKSIPQVHVTGTLRFDGYERVFSDLQLEGVMVVLDSITSEDIEVEFDTESQETYSFEPVQDNEEEVIVVKRNTIDLNPEIYTAIAFEAPMSITKLPRDQYPKGNGWQLLSDQDEQEETIDPRWAKLKDFQLDED